MWVLIVHKKNGWTVRTRPPKDTSINLIKQTKLSISAKVLPVNFPVCNFFISRFNNVDKLKDTRKFKLQEWKRKTRSLFWEYVVVYPSTILSKTRFLNIAVTQKWIWRWKKKRLNFAIPLRVIRFIHNNFKIREWEREK